MRIASIGHFWLTLFLLIATFSSKPFGSMEQGVPEANRPIASADSLPATRLSTEPDAAGSAVEPRQPHARDFPQQLAFPARTIHLPALNGGALVGCGLTHTSSNHSIPLCERLPYDANAPPVAA
jgi:hypothetical protein